MANMHLYKFIATDIESDVTNDKGKITKYKEVNVVAYNALQARVKAKLDCTYDLQKEYNLGKDWK